MGHFTNPNMPMTILWSFRPIQIGVSRASRTTNVEISDKFSLKGYPFQFFKSLNNTLFFDLEYNIHRCKVYKKGYKITEFFIFKFGCIWKKMDPTVLVWSANMELPVRGREWYHPKEKVNTFITVYILYMAGYW